MMLVLEVAKIPLVLGDVRKSKHAVGLGVGDVGIDNGRSPAQLRHQFDKLARLIQVVQEAKTKDDIKDATVAEVVHVIADKSQVGQTGRGFD